jgi:hypothetical protein
LFFGDCVRVARPKIEILDEAAPTLTIVNGKHRILCELSLPESEFAVLQ